MTVEATRSLIERYFQAFNDRSIQGMLDCMSEDMVHDVNQGGRRIGKEQFKTFLIHMARCYDEELADIVIMTTDDANRAAAEFTVHGTYRETDDDLPPARGQSYTISAGTFFEIDDGLITRVTTYYNLEEWIAKVST